MEEEPVVAHITWDPFVQEMVEEEKISYTHAVIYGRGPWGASQNHGTNQSERTWKSGETEHVHDGHVGVAHVVCYHLLYRSK